jgi:riboflavin biosynthesis pyrimidine reductase
MVSASIKCLYLRENLRRFGKQGKPYVYTNFIASLDGRVAVRDVDKTAAHIPPTISNARDWRLYQELAAQADVIVISAGQARAMAKNRDILPFPFHEPIDTCDLKQWRLSNGCSENPTVAVVTSSLDLPLENLIELFSGGLVCVTGEDVDQPARVRAQDAGIKVLSANPGSHVTGKGLTRALDQTGLYCIYSVAGAGVMRTLLQDRVLDRLYLTQVHRLIGGTSFDTLVEAPAFSPPADLNLISLYQDNSRDNAFSQTFATYDIG